MKQSSYLKRNRFLSKYILLFTIPPIYGLWCYAAFFAKYPNSLHLNVLFSMVFLLETVITILITKVRLRKAKRKTLSSQLADIFSIFVTTLIFVIAILWQNGFLVMSFEVYYSLVSSTFFLISLNLLSVFVH